MNSDKRCSNCEWWDGDEKSYDAPCLRWPSEPWLRTTENQRCWQHCKRGINEFLTDGPG